jgi:flagellar basal body-associated protein FliL
VKLKVSSLKILLKKAAEALNMVNGKSKAEQTLKSAIRKNYGEEAIKVLFSILKDTIPGLITGVKLT